MTRSERDGFPTPSHGVAGGCCASCSPASGSVEPGWYANASAAGAPPTSRVAETMINALRRCGPPRHGGRPSPRNAHDRFCARHRLQQRILPLQDGRTRACRPRCRYQHQRPRHRTAAGRSQQPASRGVLAVGSDATDRSEPAHRRCCGPPVRHSPSCPQAGPRRGHGGDVGSGIKTQRLMVFETGQADEVSKSLARELAFMGDDPRASVGAFQTGLRFERVPQIASFAGYKNVVERDLVIVDKPPPHPNYVWAPDAHRCCACAATSCGTAQGAPSSPRTPHGGRRGLRPAAR